MTDSTNRIPDLLPWVELTKFWSDLEPQSQSELLDRAALLEFGPGEYITIDFGLMISGTVGIEYTVDNGRRSIAELFHSGDLVNMRRHERQPQGRLIALGDCSLLSLDIRDFETCARHHGDVTAAYNRRIEDQVGRMRDHANDLAVKTPLERIVSVLFELRRWPGASLGQAREVALPILRKDIAAYVGIKPETVSRALRRLLEAGLIKSGTTERESIVLIDPPSLRRIANGGEMSRRRESA
ncbi:MAG: Crp/Fnr family transcriptional regulator [Pseudomonadota bacterium]